MLTAEIELAKSSFYLKQIRMLCVQSSFPLSALTAELTSLSLGTLDIDMNSVTFSGLNLGKSEK